MQRIAADRARLPQTLAHPDACRIIRKSWATRAMGRSIDARCSSRSTQQTSMLHAHARHPPDAAEFMNHSTRRTHAIPGLALLLFELYMQFARTVGDADCVILGDRPHNGDEGSSGWKRLRYDLTRLLRSSLQESWRTHTPDASTMCLRKEKQRRERRESCMQIMPSFRPILFRHSSIASTFVIFSQGGHEVQDSFKHESKSSRSLFPGMI